MNAEDKMLERLANHRTKAPDDFTDRVITALPGPSRAVRRNRGVGFWPAQGRWITPALAGAAAMWLIVFGMGRLDRPVEMGQVSFHFELHAPGADRVELLGTFNEWKSGDIVLNGPDASGHWTAEVVLPEGRHEYVFLVDGERWIADPNVATHRPDGFGRVNTVIKVYDEQV